LLSFVVMCALFGFGGYFRWKWMESQDRDARVAIKQEWEDADREVKTAEKNLREAQPYQIEARNEAVATATWRRKRTEDEAYRRWHKHPRDL